ncbi:MAG TPA: DUF4912 domain-containing protein, partial [bacterium]|nr:DUF4912 domain-containing protein [bacterium]
ARKAPAKKEASDKKSTAAKPKKTTVRKKSGIVSEKPSKVSVKVDDSQEEAKVSAAKFYPAQMEEKNGETYKQSPAAAEKDETAIPERYHDNKIVLMARDPYWCYSYWDISSELMNEKIKAVENEESYTLVLRVHDVTDVVFNGSNSHKHQDITVTGDANNWYINVWEAGRSYIVELGFRTESGKFILIARSNTVGTPRDRVSDKTDEEWMTVDEDYDELMKASGGSGTAGGGSEGFGRSIDIDLSSGGVSSFSSPAGGGFGEKKGFFLVADTELILYGTTEKDANLKVKGQAIRLTEDGSFSLRFHLPNGVMELPIDAVSADGKDAISIKITVERKTE